GHAGGERAKAQRGVRNAEFRFHQEFGGLESSDMKGGPMTQRQFVRAPGILETAIDAIGPIRENESDHLMDAGITDVIKHDDGVFYQQRIDVKEIDHSVIKGVESIDEGKIDLEAARAQTGKHHM